MARIAIVSDIHSNLTALEAVLASIQENHVDMIYGLGDIIGKGPSPVEVLDLCMEHFTSNILGNWEDFILHSQVNEEPIQYYRNRLTASHWNFLKSMEYNLEFFLSGRLVRLFHAHPNDVYRRVFSFSDLELQYDMFLPPTEYSTKYPSQNSDVVVYGDIHYPYEVHFNDQYYQLLYQRLRAKNSLSQGEFETMYRNTQKKLRGKTLVNAGSAGQPFDGTLATYVILEGDYQSFASSELNIYFMRIPYDTKRASEIALASSMPDKFEYSNEILTGTFRGRSKINYTINK